VSFDDDDYVDTLYEFPQFSPSRPLDIFCIRLTELSSYVLHRPRRGTAAAAPSPFRPGNPALCWSHPLVTPY